jgi:hypothetical protein
VGPRAGLDDVKRRKFLTLPGLELRHLGRPARSQSLYRLRYPGSVLEMAGRLILGIDLRFRLVTPDAAQSVDSLAKAGFHLFCNITTKVSSHHVRAFNKANLKRVEGWGEEYL